MEEKLEREARGEYREEHYDLPIQKSFNLKAHGPLPRFQPIPKGWCLPEQLHPDPEPLQECGAGSPEL